MFKYDQIGVTYGIKSFGSCGIRLLGEEDDVQLEVEGSVLQRVMLDALQAAEPRFIEPYLHVLVEPWQANAHPFEPPIRYFWPPTSLSCGSPPGPASPRPLNASLPRLGRPFGR